MVDAGTAAADRRGNLPVGVEIMRFDRSRLTELVGDDEDVVREIATLFVSDSRDLLAQMQDAAVRADDVLLRRLGHTLKSSAASVGCAAVSDLAERLEMEGLGAAFALLPTIVAEFDGAVQEMGALVGFGQTV